MAYYEVVASEGGYRIGHYDKHYDAFIVNDPIYRDYWWRGRADAERALSVATDLLQQRSEYYGVDIDDSDLSDVLCYIDDADDIVKYSNAEIGAEEFDFDVDAVLDVWSADEISSLADAWTAK